MRVGGPYWKRLAWMGGVPGATKALLAGMEEQQETPVAA